MDLGCQRREQRQMLVNPLVWRELRSVLATVVSLPMGCSAKDRKGVLFNSHLLMTASSEGLSVREQSYHKAVCFLRGVFADG